MITIDPSSQTIVSAKKLLKLNKKDIAKKANFSYGARASKNNSSNKAEEITTIAPMLFLQEIDQYSGDLQDLDNFADQAFASLKNLQLSLMQNSLSLKHLQNLKDSLNSAKTKFFTPELDQLANEIKTRVEVEIAKIEVNKI